MQTMTTACDILALQMHAIMARRGLAVVRMATYSASGISLADRIREIDATNKA
jgi:hypothetical protein